MVSRRAKVQCTAAFGLVVAMYAYYVENKLEDPFYEPACNGSIFGGSCATVRSWV